MRPARLTVAALFVVAALASASAADAAPDWTPPADLPAGWATASLGFAADGTALAAHVDIVSQSPPNLKLTIERRRAGRTWTPELVIDDPGGEPVDVSLAVAPSGAAVAVWQEVTAPGSPNSPKRYRAAFRAPAGTWGAPVTFAQQSKKASNDTDIAAAIAPDGTAAAGAVVDEMAHYGEVQDDTNVVVAVRPRGGPWGGTEQLSPANVSAAGLELAFDDAGQLTGAWAERHSEGASASDADDRWRVTTRRRGASNGIWGAADDLTGSVGSVIWPLLAVGPGGRAVIAWQWHTLPDGSLDAWAATRPSAGGAWSAPERIADAVSASPRAVGVGPDGATYVLYSHQGESSGKDGAAVVRLPAAGAWGQPKMLRSNQSALTAGRITFAGPDAVLAWEGNDNATGSHLLQAARWNAGAAAPEAARDIVQPDAGQGLTALIGDRRGSVVAQWGFMKLRTAVLDGGGPELAASRVPASGVAGRPLTVSATFADMWSPIGGPPTWDFGDGTAAARGATVTHTFARPGRYTITVRAADALANRAARKFTVTVAAPAPVPAPPPAPAPPAEVPVTAPAISGLRISPNRIPTGRLLPKLVRRAATAPVGTIQFRLSKAATVRLRFARLGKDGATTRVKRSIRIKANQGVNRIRFAARVTRRVALKPGTYRLTAVATDRAGVRSKRARTRFTAIKPTRR
jgi:PKD domain